MPASNSSPTLVRISELARLAGVSAPTIKHYMREGLLPGPAQRTSRNMSYYDVRLADRVRAIKELQETHFLPLRMIADLLKPAPSAQIRADLELETRRKIDGLAPAIRAAQDVTRMMREGSTFIEQSEVLAKMHITRQDLRELAKLGLSEAGKSVDGKALFSGPDLELLQIISETRDKGLGDLFPLEILEPYVACIRTLVRMEIETFRQRVLESSAGQNAQVPDVAKEASYLSERLVMALRAKLVLTELKAIQNAPDTESSRGASKVRREAGNKSGN